MKRMSRRKKRRSLVLYALFFIALLLIISVIMVACRTEKGEETTPNLNDSHIYIGDPVLVGTVEVTPTHIEQVSNALSNTEVKGELIKVNLNFKQTGHKDSLFVQEDFRVKVNDKLIKPYLQLPLEDSAFSIFLYEAEEKSGSVYFEVPIFDEKGSYNYELILQSDEGSDTTDAIWSFTEQDIDRSRFNK